MQVSAHHHPLKLIFLQCEPKALANSSSVCKLWHTLITDEKFSKHLLERDFPRIKMRVWYFEGTSYQIYQSFQRIHANMRRGHYQQSLSIFRLPDNDFERTPDNNHMLETYKHLRYFSVIPDGKQRNSIEFYDQEAPIVAARILNNVVAISASGNRVMKLWDIVSGKCLSTLDGSAEQLVGLEVLHRKGIILTASQDGKISQWSQQFKLLKVIDTGISRMSSMALSIDENIMVTSAVIGERNQSASIHFWDLHDMKVLQTIELPDGIPTQHPVIHGVQMSDNGSQVLLFDEYYDYLVLDFGIRSA